MSPDATSSKTIKELKRVRQLCGDGATISKKELG